MKRSKIKKLLIGTAIFLATTIPISGKESKLEKIVMFSKSDSFISSPYKISKREKRIIIGLDELSVRLSKDGFDRNKILDYYSDKRFRTHRNIGYNFISNPEKKADRGEISYEEYRDILGLDDKIKEAPAFLKKYREDLGKAEEDRGVDRRYLVSITGVESDYREDIENIGKYIAFNAATSLYNTHKREFAYKQLKEFLVLCKKNKIDIYKIKSSYALCAGPEQFLFGNINKYFRGNFFNMADWIPAVAHYLKDAGWDSEQNNIIPKKGSNNWETLLEYNDSDNWVRAVIELATTANWDPADLNYKLSN